VSWRIACGLYSWYFTFRPFCGKYDDGWVFDGCTNQAFKGGRIHFVPLIDVDSLRELDVKARLQLNRFDFFSEVLLRKLCFTWSLKGLALQTRP